MRKGGGKGKGASFERKVCVALSRFIDPEGEDTIFWRSAMSGGRATVQGKKGVANKSQLGDITCVHEKGTWLTENFFIECKFYADLNIESFWFKKKGKLYEFWRKARKEAKKNERHPMLIAKQNRWATIVLTTMAGTTYLKTVIGEISPVIHDYRNRVDIYKFDELFKKGEAT